MHKMILVFIKNVAKGGALAVCFYFIVNVFVIFAQFLRWIDIFGHKSLQWNFNVDNLIQDFF